MINLSTLKYTKQTGNYLPVFICNLTNYYIFYKILPWNEDKVRFLKLYAMYEDIIYRFSLGEDDSFREFIETYAYPIIWMMKSIKGHGNDSIVDMFSKKYGIVFLENSDRCFRTTISNFV